MKGTNSGGRNKDREVWIGKNRLYLGEDNILYINVVGEIDKKIAVAIQEADLKFKNMVGKKYDVLANLNKIGKHSSEARKIWKEMTEDDKTGKIAMFGTHSVARVLATFVMGTSKKKDIRFFKTRKEALGWLKG